VPDLGPSFGNLLGKVWVVLLLCISMIGTRQLAVTVHCWHATFISCHLVKVLAI